MKGHQQLSCTFRFTLEYQQEALLRCWQVRQDNCSNSSLHSCHWIAIEQVQCAILWIGHPSFQLRLMVVYPQFHVYLKIAKSSNYYFKLLVLDLDCLFLAKQGFLVDLVFKIVALEELFALPGPLASIK
jgi:hypothetical protein